MQLGLRFDTVIARLLEDPEPTVRLAALNWLERSGLVKTVRPALAALMARELNGRCREVAVRCLEACEP